MVATTLSKHPAQPPRLAGTMRALQYWILLLCLLLPTARAGHCQQASTPREIQESIREQEQTVRSEQQGLQQLTAKEAAIFTDLAAIEKRITAQEAQLRTQEAQLGRIEANQEDMEARIKDLEEEQRRGRQELRAVLAGLWPVHASSLFSDHISGADSWDEADRTFTWYAAIYGSVQEKLNRVQQREAKLRRYLLEQQELRRAVAEQLETIQAGKEQLLRDRLTFLERVQNVRARRMAKEEKLDQIRATIEDLRYRLKTLTTRSFQELKGHLPWPAQGRVVSTFAPSADPPARGIGLVLPEATSIKAVSWGKVVHNDQMRGFGRVVILYHDDDYYSLYAFLSDSPVTIGQDLEKGEPLGTAGFYPEVGGPGLYFELRFGSKPINPFTWLVALQ